MLTCTIGVHEMWQALEVQLSLEVFIALIKHLAWSYRRSEAVEYPKTRWCNVGVIAAPRWHASDGHDMS